MITLGQNADMHRISIVCEHAADTIMAVILGEKRMDINKLYVTVPKSQTVNGF